MRRRAWAPGLAAAATLLHAQPGPESPKGTVERIKVHGRSLEKNRLRESADREVSIYLPPGYNAGPRRRYPVVYLLHGYPLTDQYWTGKRAPWVAAAIARPNVPEAMERLIARGLVRPMIVVMPNADTVKGRSLYTDPDAASGLEKFIADDLVGYIDAHYATLANRVSRGLAGHSMGAYGAVRIGMKRPDVFSSLYLMSVCCLVYGPNQRLDGKNAPPAPPRLVEYAENLKQYRAIAADVGTRDQLAGVGEFLDGAFTRLGVPHSFETYAGDHMDQIADRIETKVLPFFSGNLAFDSDAGR